jgi:hypothetical protein
VEYGLLGRQLVGTLVFDSHNDYGVTPSSSTLLAFDDNIMFSLGVQILQPGLLAMDFK